MAKLVAINHSNGVSQPTDKLYRKHTLDSSKVVRVLDPRDSEKNEHIQIFRQTSFHSDCTSQYFNHKSICKNNRYYKDQLISGY